jgi:hypothetical protein
VQELASLAYSSTLQALDASQLEECVSLATSACALLERAAPQQHHSERAAAVLAAAEALLRLHRAAASQCR